jgi:serine/threonine protein kinase/formylglycine-generating enzyme required for sulfatase activity
MIGKSFNDYTILEPLGSGGMSKVYLAFQKSLEREVAIKIITFSSPQQMSKDIVERFLREAKLAGSLQHPNIVNIYSAGSEENFFYLAMEYVQGNSLAVEIAKNPLPEADVWNIAAQMCLALQVAMQNQIIHRDIKPANILLNDKKVAKLTDFGISKKMNEQSDLTQVGIVLGTPEYMSPEQASCDTLDCRSDIYSLGATLYHAITGHPMFKGEALDVMFKHKFEPVRFPDMDIPFLSKESTAILGKMLNKQPKDRYQTHDDLLADIRALLNHKPLVIARGASAFMVYRGNTSETDTTAVIPTPQPFTEDKKEHDSSLFYRRAGTTPVTVQPATTNDRWADTTRRRSETGQDTTKRRRVSHLRKRSSPQRSGKTPITETILQRLLLSLRLVTFEQINQCVQEQVRLKLQNRDDNLQQVLVSMGVVDDETIDNLWHFRNEHGESLLPGYQVEKLIGEGGLSAVYLAHQTDRPEQQVAIKVFAPQEQDASSDIVRFMREGEVARMLDHPNIVKAYELGEFSGMYYIVMEYVPGITLDRKIITEGPLEEKNALSICEKILQALINAWEVGFVHRDIKPGNILIAEESVKVADFGLAKALKSDIQITQRALVGTPCYMSPEQSAGEELDYRTDVYSLGITLYAMLTAHLPFSDTSKTALARQNISAPPLHPSQFNVTVSRPAVAFVFKLLAQEPKDRCHSPEELLANLQRVRNGKMPKGPLPYFHTARNKLLRAVAISVLILFVLAGGSYAVFTALIQKQSEQDAALAAIALQKADACRQHGETTLANGDFDTAYRLFSDAHANYKMAQTQNPAWNEMDVKTMQICESWFNMAMNYYQSDDAAKLELALQCCAYCTRRTRLRTISSRAWLKVENLEKKIGQKLEELKKKRQEALVNACKECQNQGERLLEKGDVETAYAMFVKAVNSGLSLDKEYPSLAMSQDMTLRIGESWLHAARNRQKENKLEEALQCCRYGLRIQQLAFEVKEELRKIEKEVEKAIEAKSAFAMTAEKLWLAKSQEKNATCLEVFDVQDKIYLHATLQLENYDGKSHISARCHGDIEETKVSLNSVPTRGEYHWTTLLSCKKARGEYKMQLEIFCKAIAIAKELTFKLVQLAEDLTFLGKNDMGYEEYSRSKDKMVMVLIPAGEFAMGDPTEDGYVDERPRHTVALDAYLMDKYEVSNAQYAIFLNWWQTTWPQEKSKYDWQLSKEAMQELHYSGDRLPKYWGNQQYNKPELPVVGVTWFDAYAYARWANNITQRGEESCLPSEAQWEKAAAWHEKTTKALIYPCGAQIEAQKANYWNGDRKGTEPVTDHAIGVSPYGLYNMAGNVAEWCDDWYDRKYYSLSPRANPINHKIGKSKVFRGGGFNSKEWEIRNSRRRSFEPHLSNVETGFRCVRRLEDGK